MIKSWNKFFEANKGEFTEEMAQEILYTFGEYSKGYSSDDPEIKDFLRSGAIWQGITFYETDYSEMKEFTKTLMKNAERNPEVKAECIRVYNYIRKQNEIFPEIFLIEDYYLSLIEKYGFNFYVNIDMGTKYEIKLTIWNNWKEASTLDKFIEMCREVERSMKRIESKNYKVSLNTCELTKYSVEFKIDLEK